MIPEIVLIDAQVRSMRDQDAFQRAARLIEQVAYTSETRSQALAALRGRDFVIPDDVKALATPILAHRLILHSDTRLRGRSSVDVVQSLVSRVPVPVE